MNQEHDPNLHDYLSSIGKRGAAGRRTKPGVCAVCGTPFAGLNRRQYCSASCRLKASRERRQGTERPMPGHRVSVLEPASPSETKPEAIPPLVAHLDATRAAISRGRVFEDSAEVIRQARAERDAAISGR